VSSPLLPSLPPVLLPSPPSSLVSSLASPVSSEVDNPPRKNPPATESSLVEVSLASSSEKERESSS
jgi:hypothetical protein